MMPSLSELLTTPRKFTRQVGIGNTTVISGACRLFSAHFQVLLSASPNPHGLLFNNTSTSGTPIRIEPTYGNVSPGPTSPTGNPLFPGPGLGFDVGLTIQVVGGGTLVVSYLEE